MEMRKQHNQELLEMNLIKESLKRSNNQCNYLPETFQDEEGSSCFDQTQKTVPKTVASIKRPSSDQGFPSPMECSMQMEQTSKDDERNQLVDISLGDIF